MTKRMVGRNWYRLRFEVLERDKFQCQYCGQYAPNVRLEVDHILAVSDGGTDALENLRTSCFACNQGKVGLWEYRNWLPRGRRTLDIGKFIGKRTPPQPPTLRDMILAVLDEPKTVKEISMAIDRRSVSVAITLRRMETIGLVKNIGRTLFGSRRAFTWIRTTAVRMG